jgi:hypothetical protein
VASTVPPGSGTIACVFPSTPQDGDRDPWGPELSREIARSGTGRSSSGFYAGAPEREPGTAGLGLGRPESHEEVEDEHHHDIEVVPVRRQLSVAIAGFAGLLAAGLILGAQTSGPDARTPYAIVIFGVQLLFVLAWTMAMRPPAAATVAGVCVVAGLLADYAAVTNETAHLLPLLYVAMAAFVAAIIGQSIRAADRRRATDSLGATLLLVLGVVAFASLIVLTRKPIGTQAVMVCLAAAGVSLVVARLTDAIFAKPRIAPQVPRGATGVILGAMLGTLAAAGLGSVLVLPFNPAKGAILGLVAAGLAGLVDLAVNYTEASRSMAGDAPTFWLARHMQGPLGAFALTSPVAYALTVFFLS